MAIDIRATVSCSLGTLISASINDDYVQGTGLIKCKGTCEISGTITPAIGTVVTFTYAQNGITRTVPRKLRVLSSFADPFRRTTRVELGCKLTYLQDLQEEVDWDAFDDPDNSTLTASDARIVTIPIRAKSIMNQCLSALGLSASSNPLTNKFSVAQFDFSSGYVQILSDLLQSESYCGYLDRNELLQVFSLDQQGGTGPVLDSSRIIDLGAIGVGQLPGEAVTVSYSTLKLKQPDPNNDEQSINWERTDVVGPVTTYYVQYGENATATYTGQESTTTLTTYAKLDLNYFMANRTNETRFYSKALNSRDVKISETVTTTSPSVTGEEKYASERLANGLGYFPTPVTSRLVVTNYTYSLTTGEQTGYEQLEYEPQSFAICRLGIPLVFAGNPVASAVTLSSALLLVRKVVEANEKVGTFTRTVTTEYVWGPRSQQGNQGAAQAAQYIATLAQAQNYIANALQAGLVSVGSTVVSTQVGLADYQGRPSGAGRINGQYADGGDPNNGWQTQSKADLQLALGSATAQRRIEFSMTYAPDDVFSGSTGGPFTAVASDAEAKATRYGRCQNRLLLGNRNGMNVQCAASQLPEAPFAPFFISANGLSGLYRTNGMSWQMDSSGILVSCDALFWGAAGGTGTFWFPVAPGISTLPAAPTVSNTAPTTVIGTVATVGVNPQTTLNAAFPAAVNGNGVQDLSTDQFWRYNGSTWINVGLTPGPTATVSAVVPVWNETAVVTAATRSTVEITSFAYALSVLTNAALSSRTQIVVTGIRTVNVPAASLTIASAAPTVSGGILIPVSSLTVAALVPSVFAGVLADAPVTALSVSMPLPAISTTQMVPVGSITYSQSSVYSGTTAAGNSLMTDKSGTTGGAATNNGAGQWVKMDLGASYDIAKVYIGAAHSSVPGGFNRVSYTSNCDVQYSADNVNWTLAFNTGSTFANPGDIVSTTVAFTARYIRILNASGNWLALTEFYALAPGQTY